MVASPAPRVISNAASLSFVYVRLPTTTRRGVALRKHGSDTPVTHVTTAKTVYVEEGKITLAFLYVLSCLSAENTSSSDFYCSIGRLPAGRIVSPAARNCLSLSRSLVYSFK